jgi:alanyl-tRNA synthetase
LQNETTVTALQQLDDERYLVKLAQSPFYAEGGGQVGDQGKFESETGHAAVQAVMRYDNDQVIVASIDGTINVGDTVKTEVDWLLRSATEANHTATHLLHKALRDRLGDHVHQAGSLVAPDRLRFDFTHQQGLTAEDLIEIESVVNDQIAKGATVGWQELDIEEARKAGAMMLFGEKYGDRVRMVDVGNGWSRELCGGTHVHSTGQIQLMKITSETSVGAGVRRIEAVTGVGAIVWLTSRADAAEAAAVAASTSIERLAEKVEDLVATNRVLEREITKLRSGSVLDDALASAVEVEGFKVVAFRADALDGDELLDLSDRIKGKLGSAAVLLGSGSGDDSVQLVANLTEDAVRAGLKAGDVIGKVAKMVGGGGGGRPNMARAGGKDPSKLDEALDAGRQAMVETLTGSAARA